MQVSLTLMSHRFLLLMMGPLGNPGRGLSLQEVARCERQSHNLEWHWIVSNSNQGDLMAENMDEDAKAMVSRRWADVDGLLKGY